MKFVGYYEPICLLSLVKQFRSYATAQETPTDHRLCGLSFSTSRSSARALRCTEDNAATQLFSALIRLGQQYTR